MLTCCAWRLTDVWTPIRHMVGWYHQEPQHEASVTPHLVWNSLLRTVLDSFSDSFFTSRLKTHMFHLNHNDRQWLTWSDLVRHSLWSYDLLRRKRNVCIIIIIIPKYSNCCTLSQLRRAFSCSGRWSSFQTLLCFFLLIDPQPCLFSWFM